MLYAVGRSAARSSAARCKSFDATRAKAVPGVKNVVQISNGVAVVADNTWSANAGTAACWTSSGTKVPMPP